VTDSTSTNYELRIKNPNASATDGIVISNVIVGPGSRVQMPDPRWPSYTTTTLVTGTDWTTNNVDLIPYQTSDDTWRLKLNIYGSLGTAASSVVLTIDDVTSSYFQALSVTNATSSRVGSAVFNSTTDKINAWIVTGATGTGWIISGDIAIDDKPTWATKSAPDLYLSGAVNTDQVVAVYNGGGVTIAGGTIDSTARILTFPGTTYIRDTDSAYSSGTFTAPSSGEYFISANVRVNDSGWAANEYVDLYIYKEGSVVAMATVRAQTSGSFELQPNVNSSIYLTAGETIDIRLASNGGATSFSTTNSNTLSIVKLPSPQDVANMIVGFNTATEDRPGLVSAYKYEELTANSGDFTNGETLRIAKVGSVVTLTWPALAHAAKSVPISAAGLIPSIYLPNDIFYNLSYSAGGTVSRVSITTDGKIEFTHRDWAGVAVTPTSSAGGSISWVVDE